MNTRILLLMFFLGSRLFSQAINPGWRSCETKIWAAGFTRAGTDYWSAGGANIADVDAPVRGVINPAGTSAAAPAVYAELGKTNGSYHFSGVNGALCGTQAFPAFIGVSVPYKSIQISAGFSKYYHSNEGWGGGLNTIKNTNVVWGSLAYPLNETLVLGMTLGMTLFSHSDYSSNRNKYGTGRGLGYFAAAGYKLKLLEPLYFATAVRYLDDVKYTYNLDIFIVPLPGSGMDEQKRLEIQQKCVVKFPVEFETGFCYKIGTLFDLSGKVGIQKWGLPVQDQLFVFNYYLGTGIVINKYLTMRLGCFTFDHNDSNVFDKNVRCRFLTLGGRVHLFRAVKVSFSLLDSGFLIHKKHDFWQTHYSLGILYKL